MSQYLPRFIIESMESGRMGGQRLPNLKTSKFEDYSRSCKAFITLDYSLPSEDYYFNKVIIIFISYIIIIILIFS